MIRVFLFYALSGFVSLGYQVAWFRIFTDWFGATNLTFALVVCNFIGGLGFGALLSERMTRVLVAKLGMPDRLRVYGVVEILVGTTALLTMVAAYMPADLWGVFPYSLIDGIWEQNGMYRFGQVIFAAGCVFIPCVFMGVTFPLICNAFVPVPEGERLPAALYAWNTLGACTGVLVCQFLLLPWAGHSMTFWLMAGLNILLGVYFLATGGAPAAVDSGGGEHSGDPSGDPRGLSALLAIAALSGLLSGALEGDMFKRISFAMQTNPGAVMSFISFWAIAAIFLGSAAVRLSTRIRLVHIKIALVACVIAYWTAWQFMYPLIQALSRRNFSPEMTLLAESFLGFPASTFQLFYFVGAFVFVPYFLVSLMLPYVCNRIQAQRKHLGLAYGLNTVAFCIGMIGFALLAPRVNIFYSLKLTMVLLVCGAIFLLLLSDKKRLEFWKPGAVGAAFIVACFFVPSDFDVAYMFPDSGPTRYPVRALKSNGANTTFVLKLPGEERLYFGNLSMSGTNGLSQTYMRLMAHFPLLAQANPTKALLICFGIGNTASAIAAHETIDQIDIVDLNDKVFETAPEFEASNFGVHLDPRLRLIHDDGRNFLQLTDQTYDLITSEPPPPMAAGTYRLYSREYYEDILEHLTPEGMMTQWLPVYQMPQEAVDLAIATFIEVFPSALLFVGYENELILVGGRLPIDLQLMQRRFFESERVIADLARIVVQRPADLFARILRTDKSLRSEYSSGRQISDEHNDLEHLYMTPAQIPIIEYDPYEVLEFIFDQSPDLAESVAPILTHLGRLRYRVPRFPVFGVESDPSIALSDANWRQITMNVRRAQVMHRQGNTLEAIRNLIRVLQLAPAQPAALMVLADLYMQVNAYDEAAAALRNFQLLEPDESSGYIRMGDAFLGQGKSREALQQYQQAIALDPDSSQLLNNAAWILATHPDDSVRNPAEATRFAERAVQLTGRNNPFVLDTLAVAYASDGRFDEAISVTLRVISLAVEMTLGGLEKEARQHLERYKNREAITEPS
jgi:spermidine synthase